MEKRLIVASTWAGRLELLIMRSAAVGARADMNVDHSSRYAHDQQHAGNAPNSSHQPDGSQTKA